MTNTRIRVAAALAALCLVGPLAGCTSGDTATSVASSASPTASTSIAAVTASPVADGSSVRKSPSANRSSNEAAPSYSGPAITLSIGTDDSPGVPNADEIVHFVDTVKDLGGGKITIEPKWHADGDGHLDWDQQVAAMVQSGRLDLALGPTWAWDVLHVKSFEPLQSPFLIDSDALVAAVITDKALPDQLMSGMPAAGVTGLSLWPEGLRHPFGFDGPVLAASDYHGKTVRSPESAATTAIFKALGAKTTAEEPDATTMVGIQSEYAYSPNGTGAANVTFFPKVNVLYANAESYGKLDDSTKHVLAAAAAETQKWAIDRTDDVKSGAAFCDDGGTLVHASADDVAGLVAATKPVAETIASAHPDVIADIAALKQKYPRAGTAGACAPTVAVTTHAPGAAESALNGTYRFTVSAQDFQQAGLPTNAAINNAGVQTFVLKNGKVHFTLDPSGHEFHPAGTNQPDEVDGTYQIDGEQLTFWFPAYDNEMDRFRFSVTDGGDLKLSLLETTGEEAGIDLLMAGKVWERIG
jgi:TRAP-type C4-dicarboxylate transport system substrate-binding protein